MPIFMQLLIDQREISRLLVECGNSPLPVEVKQLRINPASLRRPGRSDVSSMFMSPKAGGGGRLGGAGSGMGSESSNASDRELNPYDVPIELQGIIYIFNPPNRAKLAVAGQAAEIAPAEEASPPDASPAPVPTGASPEAAPAATGLDAGAAAETVAPVASPAPAAAP